MTHKHWRAVVILGGLAAGFFVSGTWKARNWGDRIYINALALACPTCVGPDPNGRTVQVLPPAVAIAAAAGTTP